MGANKPGQVGDSGEVTLHLIGHRLDLDAVDLADGHPQFQRVDGIEAQTGIAEQRLVRGDILRRQILELQGRDDQAFQIQFQCIHDPTFPRKTLQ